MFPPAINALAEAVLAEARARSLHVATAESCTGGLISGALTGIAGSSDVFERGFVTYSNTAKCEQLGVPATLIAAHGAVSEAVARAMAEGALAHAPAADLAVAVTGVAGPGGGTAAKPVGFVCLATARRGGATLSAGRHFGDAGRDAVRLAAVEAALLMLREQVRG